MTAIDDVLSATKTLLGTMSTMTSTTGRVYIYPNDWESIATDLSHPTDHLPLITIERTVNREDSWVVKAAGRGWDIWEMDIRCYLMEGPLLTDEQRATAASSQWAWPKALADILFANGTLNGTCNIVGLYSSKPAKLFDSVFGHLPWVAGKEFWGMAARVMVQQTHNQVMQA